MRAYVGIGGNVGAVDDIVARFASAIAAIAGLPYVTSVRRSPIYTSSPQGPIADQPRYLNAVLELDLATVPLSPRKRGQGLGEGGVDPTQLLHDLLAIETAHGRDRTNEQAQGPRSLDLDLLVFGDQVADTAELTLPHPRMHQRAFVLVPLADLADRSLAIPGHGSLADCLAAADVQRQALDLALLPVEQPANVAAVSDDDQ